MLGITTRRSSPRTSPRTRTTAALAVLLGASLLLAVPSTSQAREGQAKQGKWWTTRQSGDDGRRGGHDGRGISRQWQSWGGRRIYRDLIVVRGVNRGPRYRSWRTYCPPEYIYARRVIRVRPVRFYVAVVIGGVSIRGSYHGHDDDCVYGCNFCDARFSDYDGYRVHVGACSHRPHGYRVECSDWEASAGHGWDDRGWRDEDEIGYDRGDYRDYSDGRDYQDDGYYDEDYIR
jgi:hypothetical protein